MKKLLMFLLMLLTAMALTACNGGASDEPVGTDCDADPSLCGDTPTDDPVDIDEPVMEDLN